MGLAALVPAEDARLGQGARGDRRVRRRAGGEAPQGARARRARRGGAGRRRRQAELKDTDGGHSKPGQASPVQARRLLPGLRARGHRPRLQPLDQGGRQGARPRARRGEELELLRGDGSEERRPEDPDLPLLARDVDRRERDARGGRDGAVQRLLPQPEEGRARSRARRGVARRRRSPLAEGRARDLPGRTGRDDPRARLDQARHRRGRAQAAREEFAQGPQGRQLLRLHVHPAAPHLPGEGPGAGHRIDLEAALHGRSARGGRRGERRLPAEDRLLRRRAHALGQRHLDQARAEHPARGRSGRART